MTIEEEQIISKIVIEASEYIEQLIEDKKELQRQLDNAKSIILNNKNKVKEDINE